MVSWRLWPLRKLSLWKVSTLTRVGVGAAAATGAAARGAAANTIPTKTNPAIANTAAIKLEPGVIACCLCILNASMQCRDISAYDARATGEK